LSSVEKGNFLEKKIHDLLQSEINEGRFFAKKKHCRVFWKKGYFSKDRGSEIIFDVSIEIYLPGAKEYSLLILIECKNYSSSVSVEQAEAFFAKIQQVGAANTKAVLASTASFQSGTREYAKSKGMGLLRYFNPANFKWELKRSPSATARTISAEDSDTVHAALSQDDFRSLVFDLYFQSPLRETNSLWDFVEDLHSDSNLSPTQIRKIENSRLSLTNQVDFLEKDEIEEIATEILTSLAYSGKKVDLNRICEIEAVRTGLTVQHDLNTSSETGDSGILGSIAFDPLVIRIYQDRAGNPDRERFTLAHELAHHLLDHGRYLVREECEDSDFVLTRQSAIDGSDVFRLEFQANYLAATLLMPRAYLASDFRYACHHIGISDRGFGPLFLDDQPCNLKNYALISGLLMDTYGVSRTALKIRLESMGLLRDVRRSGDVQSYLRTAFTTREISENLEEE
jgi:Zn-dependent peptidase ImmA (M78 family)